MATKEYGVRTLAEHPRRRPRFDISEAKKRGPWGRQRQLRDKICREKIQMTRITEEYFRNVNVYYSRLCCLQFRKIRKFPCCTLLPSMTPKPLVKLIMHLRMLEFFPKCEGEWVAYLGRVKGIEKKKKNSSERSENQGPGDSRISGCSVVCSRVDIWLSSSLYCSLHNRPITEGMTWFGKPAECEDGGFVSPRAILPELEFRLLLY